MPANFQDISSFIWSVAMIPDGAYSLFRAPVEDTRQGKTVLVQMRDTMDPETGQRFAVKCYESEKIKQADSWHHTRVTLKPVNPDFKSIVLTGAEEGELQVITELVEVLPPEALQQWCDGAKTPLPIGAG
jgi:hypothetical protein